MGLVTMVGYSSKGRKTLIPNLHCLVAMVYLHQERLQE
jgi:hypothetical protein